MYAFYQPFTFEKDVIFSCLIKYTDLPTECASFSNLAILNLWSGLSYLGKYGNANYSLPSQFISISKATKTNPTYDSTLGVCDYKTTHLSIRYCKIGTEYNFQYVITDAAEVTESNYAYQGTSSTIISVSISFIEDTTQNSVYFYPKTPNILPAMPKNALYPFISYD
jgi:hypothetical protein